MLVGALVVTGGCATLDAENTDVKPWNRPARSEFWSKAWPWWAFGWSGSVYEEQDWLRARRNPGW